MYNSENRDEIAQSGATLYVIFREVNDHFLDAIGVRIFNELLLSLCDEDLWTVQLGAKSAAETKNSAPNLLRGTRMKHS